MQDATHCIWFVLLLLSCLNAALAAAPESNNKNDLPKKIAIIILSTDTLSEMQAAREIFEQRSVLIRAAFPPSTFIVSVSPEQAAAISGLDFVDTLSYRKVDVKRHSGSVADAVKHWNLKLDKPHLKLEERPDDPINNELITRPHPSKEERGEKTKSIASIGKNYSKN